MIYMNMPMMIFILAAGYLFTVYLLLALAKRSGQKSTSLNFPPRIKDNNEQEVSVAPQVGEIVNSQ
jgi:hypothetical protein